MSKSIWDTRFSSRPIAQDAVDGNEGEWRTINGAHIHINGEGVIDAGAEGKFNGKTLGEVKPEGKRSKEEINRARSEKIKATFARKKSEREARHAADDKKAEQLKKKFEKDDPKDMTDKQLKSKERAASDNFHRCTKEDASSRLSNVWYDRLYSLRDESDAREYAGNVRNVNDMSERELLKERDNLHELLSNKMFESVSPRLNNAMMKRSNSVFKELDKRWHT